MARKRERFERTDVPEPSRQRNVIGGIVAALALVATAAVVMFAWNRANLESRMGDNALGDAIASQASSSGPSEGYVDAGSEIHSTLLLTSDSLDAGGTLTDARILSVNATAGTATLVALPTDLALTVDEEPTTLGELFSSQGYAACVVPLGSASGISFENVILATGDVLEEASQLAGSDAGSLVRSASGFLSKIRTNMDAPGLLSFAETLSAIGVSNLTAVDAPLVAETATDEEGNVTETGRQVLDQTQLGVAAGRFVAA